MAGIIAYAEFVVVQDYLDFNISLAHLHQNMIAGRLFFLNGMDFATA